MTQSSAISNLGNQKREHFWRDVAHGIDLLISNIRRLDGSAQRASMDGDEATATLLGEFRQRGGGQGADTHRRGPMPRIRAKGASAHTEAMEQASLEGDVRARM